MEKANIYKFLYAVAALLILGFAIHTIVDAVRYDSMLTSFPFYAFLLVNAVIYLVPSLIAFIVALFMKKKVNTKAATTNEYNGQRLSKNNDKGIKIAPGWERTKKK